MKANIIFSVLKEAGNTTMWVVIFVAASIITLFTAVSPVVNGIQPGGIALAGIITLSVWSLITWGLTKDKELNPRDILSLGLCATTLLYPVFFWQMYSQAAAQFFISGLNVSVGEELFLFPGQFVSITKGFELKMSPLALWTLISSAVLTALWIGLFVKKMSGRYKGELARIWVSQTAFFVFITIVHGPHISLPFIFFFFFNPRFSNPETFR